MFFIFLIVLIHDIISRYKNTAFFAYICTYSVLFCGIFATNHTKGGQILIARLNCYCLYRLICPALGFHYDGAVALRNDEVALRIGVGVNHLHSVRFTQYHTGGGKCIGTHT